MTENIIIAVITAVVTLAGGYLATRQQREKDISNARVETEKLKIQIEKDLWERLHTELETLTDELEKESSKRQRMEATIKEQGAVISQLRGRIQTLEKDRDTWKERALKAENGGGKKGM